MNLQLGVKANLLVAGVLIALLAAILVLLRGGLADTTTRIGHATLEQEADVVRRQVENIERDIVSSALLLAASPDLVASLQNEDTTRSRTELLIAAAKYGFSGAIMAGGNGERLFATGTAIPGGTEMEDKLLRQALLGINAVGVIASSDRRQLALAIAVPLELPDGDDQITLLVTRALDAGFLTELNIGRQNIHLLLLQPDAIVASVSENDTAHEQGFDSEVQAQILANQPALHQALAGEMSLSNSLITMNEEPHLVAYLPFTVQGTVAASLAVLVDVNDLVRTQSQLTLTLTIVFTVLALAAIGLMSLFIRHLVTQPIQSLQLVAQQMAQGDYRQRAQVRSNDEIGRLARAINTTAITVEEREQSLEQAKLALEQQAVALEQNVTDLRALISERDQLSLTIRELSSPVLPILDDILVMPLIGAIDSARATLITQSLLDVVERNQTRVVILDVTGVPVIDTQVARTLLDAAMAARLLGAETILAGIRPELAQTIVGLGLQLPGLVTRADLQSSITYALNRQGRGLLQRGKV